MAEYKKPITKVIELNGRMAFLQGSFDDVTDTPGTETGNESPEEGP